ncbi:MAG: helix-turn-helix domain-containing protein [Candidatus Saganbacteria bacterium]|nr:helix-turn-helix domain-containing protein [Candidatus Saganbacteria bacterium]
MAKSSFKVLKLKQLSLSVKRGRPVSLSELGNRIRDIREALGMTQGQLAKKLKVKQPFISQIEDNIESSSFKTIQKVLAALECELSFAVVSKISLDKIVKRQASIRAEKILERTYSNMALEKQSPNSRSYKFQLKELVEDLCNNPGSELWED